ncbi:CRISPR-associated protein, Cas2 family [uncultured Desulfatiglans sp.]|uniref:CRISPR-associated protein, Cas2 family n=1 Tax=Uncultured Desulfatiglans sp. TaxID=1748965 RepID=A0A653AB35_UNCDX|nr:CRISPR-associated protein, Cas2 family [uncultured Desulfatiglans sp.]
MAMTVVVTRNVRDRIRGFLSSTMLELAPGVYTAPRISPAVRDRIWDVLRDWYLYENDASIVMLWADNTSAGGQAIRILGSPPIELVEIDGLIVSRRQGSLTT